VLFVGGFDWFLDKKTLIFDLDETLVHCNEATGNSDVILPIMLPNGLKI